MQASKPARAGFQTRIPPSRLFPFVALHSRRDNNAMESRTASEFLARATSKNMSALTAILLSLLGVVSGCRPPSFDIVEPTRFAGPISRNSDTLIAIEPLAYRFRIVEDRLVLRIFNPTDIPIEIVGKESYLIDPSGQSHAITSQTIAPNSFAKLILPPFPPDQTPNGPTISIGISSSGLEMDYPQPRSEKPSGGRSVQETWSWPANGVVRLTFHYRRGTDPRFEHSFSIQRRGM